MFPSKENLTICFAHAAYRMMDRFELRKTGIKCFEVRAYDDLVKRIGEADVWRKVREATEAGLSRSARAATELLGEGPAQALAALWADGSWRG